MNFQDKLRKLVEADDDKQRKIAEAEQQKRGNTQQAKITFAEETKQAFERIIIPTFDDAVLALKEAGIDAAVQYEKDSGTRELQGARFIIQVPDKDKHLPFLRYRANTTHNIIEIETGSSYTGFSDDPYRDASDAADWSKITREQVETNTEKLITAYLKRRQ